ncbi:homeobox-leucine zipper protein HAT22-like [Primulina huaijiensis]|uniref:homeobox-leucine zipper protein HAT22-like n=1 Tax=Primulina huaijiensis TaxID=1492673 RepID=UPI003CC79B94
MDFDDLHNTGGLVLGLGLISSPLTLQHRSKKASPAQNLDEFYGPSLNLSLSGETYQIHDSVKKVDSDNKIKVVFSDHQLSLYRQDSAASSFSNVSVKREREFGSSEEGEIERVSSRISDEDDDGSNGRKKLRLTKVQSALLEESFKIHSTLNPKQKQDLARELKLRPRQVEVWFQNRRARTKLKQTEVDCEFLKKCCETLTDENRRLQKELQELKALKLAAQPLYMQLPAATLTMCPSCERVGAASSPASDTAAKSSFTAATKPRFYNHFNSQSAAC